MRRYGARGRGERRKRRERGGESGEEGARSAPHDVGRREKRGGGAQQAWGALGACTSVLLSKSFIFFTSKFTCKFTSKFLLVNFGKFTRMNPR